MRRLTRKGLRRYPRKRRGATLVEFAVVLPLLLAILMGIVEFGWVFMVRQTLTNAAREGCRTAVLKASTEEDVATRVREVMDPLGYEEGTVWSFDATPITNETQTVTVTAPIEHISITGGYVLSGDDYTISGTCTMRKEGFSAVEDES